MKISGTFFRTNYFTLFVLVIKSISEVAGNVMLNMQSDWVNCSILRARSCIFMIQAD